MARIEVFGVEGLPEIEAGDDLAEQTLRAAAATGTPLADRDVVVITSKIVSKAEGCAVELDDIEPSALLRRGPLAGTRTRGSSRSCSESRNG